MIYFRNISAVNVSRHPAAYGQPRSQSMKSAYVGELTQVEQDIDSLRARLEKWYALRLEDEQVVDAHKEEHDTLVTSFDALMLKIASSTRLVKNAIASQPVLNLSGILG